MSANLPRTIVEFIGNRMVISGYYSSKQPCAHLRKNKCFEREKENKTLHFVYTIHTAQQNIRIYLENVKMKTANESDCIGLYAQKRNMMIAVH